MVGWKHRGVVSGSGVLSETGIKISIERPEFMSINVDFLAAEIAMLRNEKPIGPSTLMPIASMYVDNN